MEKTPKIIAIAGHWNPLHCGHLALIDEAKKLGDKLIVIVANDVQAEAKRPKVFMPLQDRMMIMRHIKGVDDVVASIDVSPDIKNTLKMIAPDVLASGCSSDHPDALEEYEVCHNLGIKTLYDVGGDKINSSSILLNDYAKDTM